MKTRYAIGLVAASVLITVAIEESRISGLRYQLGIAQTTDTIVTPRTVVAASAVSAEAPTAPERTKKRPDTAIAAPLTDVDSLDESFAKTARTMWDNPAGKSMMNQGAKMAVGMMYQDFIDSLDLTKEEGDYFKNLLGKEIGDQQELGMKMLAATAEEQKALGDELQKRASDSEAEIKKFLNSDEDIKAFTDYKNHLPERQQLDGIRTAMSSQGVPLDAATEGRANFFL